MSITSTPSSDDTRQTQERSRLVDHFKRAYQIVVGLSITIACANLFPNRFPDLPFDASFWLFCAFFITVVPIFQGGDRSLDIKYLHERPKGFFGHAAYVWDIYMLLITAILFVKIAQSLPVPQGTVPSVFNPAPQVGPENFYRWMGCLLIFGALVLIFDGLKSSLLGVAGARFVAYIPWIVLNSALGIACFVAVDPSAYTSLLAGWPALSIAKAVFGLALLRTVLDYMFGYKFMFP